MIQAHGRVVLGNDSANLKRFSANAIPLAEAAIFYESKTTPEWLVQAKTILKDYLELRIYVSDLPSSRLHLDFSQNATMIRLLRKLYYSVVNAEEGLAFVEQLPGLRDAKRGDWLTRKALEVDLMKLKGIAV